jgi:hypothetical protein
MKVMNAQSNAYTAPRHDNSAPGELLAELKAKQKALREQEARDHERQTQSFLQSEGDEAHSLEQQAALLQR